jgi:hypothetical protein
MLCFVMTHCERVPLAARGATFCFVSGTSAEVLDQAHEAAGGLDRAARRQAHHDQPVPAG